MEDDKWNKKASVVHDGIPNLQKKESQVSVEVNGIPHNNRLKELKHSSLYW